MQEKWPELVISSGNNVFSQKVRRASQRGELRKIAPKVYTSNFTDSVEEILKKNRYQLLSQLFPQAVISHRSALEGGFHEGFIVLNYKYTKQVTLPGLTIHLIKGAGADEEDTPFLENLYIASRARAFLENLRPTRNRKGYAKALTQKEVEERLERLMRVYGPEELNRLREQAKKVAGRLKMQRELAQLEQIVGALLGTRTAEGLTSETAKSRALGEPFDPQRLELFATLAAYLQQHELSHLRSLLSSKASWINLSFFESYFSNYIEGTEFALEEAEKIVFEKKIYPQRRKDSHDILSTFEIVSDQKLMQASLKTKDEFIEVLLERHRRLMEVREEVLPGRFKDVVNRAGNTIFVAPEEVRGTLLKGWSLHQQLKPGIARAIFMMFMIAEVHPFVDGNGRVARIMMNAELDAAKESRIIIPTVYREDYLLALRKLSRQHDPAPYVRMMLRAQAFTHQIPFEDYTLALMKLKSAHAFSEPSEGKLTFHE